MTTPTTNDPQQQPEVAYTKSGVPKACPNCGHPFHPRLKCYGDGDRCSCETNMAVRLDIPAPSTGATAGGDWIRAIQQRYEDHDVVYERPAHGAPCWLEYRTTGRCNCDADGDVAVLLAEVAQLRADLALAQAERERLGGHVREAAQALVGEAALHAEIKQLRAQVEAMRHVVEAAKVLFGKRGTTPTPIHHPNCVIFGATILGLTCDCGAQQIRDALAALDQPQQQEVPD